MQSATGDYLVQITRAAIGFALNDTNLATIVAVLDGSLKARSLS